MNLKIVFIQVVVLCVIYEASATFNFCKCNDEGIDVCSDGKCKKGLTAPRPYPVQAPRSTQPLIKTICKEHTIQGPKPFSPIGDICQCGRQHVKPAPLPNVKSLCSYGLPKLNFELPKCQCNSCLNLNSNNKNNDSPSDCNCGEAVRAPENYQIFNEKGSTIYLESSNKKSSAPASKPKYGNADVISVSIAQRMANSAKNGISEKQLQYGSLKEPTIAEKKNSNNRKIINVNEESFYDTHGDVLEIKSNMFKQKVESESSESSEESEEVHKKKSNSPFDPAYLKYEDIGFGTYQPSSKPRYVVVKNSEQSNQNSNRGHKTHHHRHHHHHHKKPCNCRADSAVDASSISEQSISYENDSSSGQFLHPSYKFST